MTRRIAKLLTVAAVAPVVLAGTALASTGQNSCSNYTTGTDSYNACIAATQNLTYVTCVNNVYTVFGTNQNANSGNANNTNNSNTGGATSGSAVNSNNQTVQVGTACTTAAATTGGGTTTTPTPTPTPATTTTTPVTTPKTTSIAATLPETGSNTVLQSAVIGVIALGAALAVSKAGVFAWQRLSSK